jgi:ParB-like chromosome segregation protein Spo0J
MEIEEMLIYGSQKRVVTEESDTEGLYSSVDDASGEFESVQTHIVPITALMLADSPRLAGEDPEHIRMLADSSAALPPIVVRRSNMQVIDGMHRVRAALLRGKAEIAVRFFEGDDDAAFVLAVRANVRHGLPLSLTDRRAAAERIIGSYPHWSDRRIAAVVGLSPKTVSSTRRRGTAPGIGQLQRRLGSDGRLRPVSGVDGRRAAAEFLEKNPNASLREVVEAAKISLSTASDVRARLRRGESPVSQRTRINSQKERNSSSAAHRDSDVDPSALVEKLRRDPSIRFNEAGRILLSLFVTTMQGRTSLPQIASVVPLHCADTVASIARECAVVWQKFSEQLEYRRRGTDG